MSEPKIDILIQKFYEATLSNQEEGLLKTYFESDQVEPQHVQDQALFLSLQNRFSTSKRQIETPDFEQMINQMLSKKEEEDARMLQMIDRNNPRNVKPIINKKRVWMSAAAVALLLITLSYPLYFSSLKPAKETREMTYEEYRNSMLLVSRKLNQGADQAQKADYTIHKTKKILQRTLIIMPNEN